MGDGIGFAEVLLGMPGFKITAVGELEHGELVVDVETTVTVDWCRTCGVRADAQDRMPTELRDLSCFGRPVRLPNVPAWRHAVLLASRPARWRRWPRSSA